MVYGTFGNGGSYRYGNRGRYDRRGGLRDLHHHDRLRERRRKRVARRPYRGVLLFVVVSLIGVLGVTLLGLIGAIHTATTAYANVNRDLPSINQISSRETFKTAQVYDRKGTLLWELYDQEGGKRTVVPLSDVSQYLIDATLAAEDANFYSHPGFDLRGIARAMYQNLLEQDVVSGASTITQQLVRRVLLKPEEQSERSVSRKIREALLAYQVTQKLSKSQILALYLNEIYYGNQAYGVEAAAQAYFGKRARELNLPEAAVIAGLPQSPSGYDPLRNPVAAKWRQAYVLEQMARHGFITEQQAADAAQAELRYEPQKPVFRAPHWVMYVRSLIEERYGSKLLYQGGLKIYTTLDLDLQNKLEEVARANASTLAQRDANNTSISVINPRTGEILAVVGSMDYWNAEIDGQVNIATSERQPGSTIKPIVYLAAFAKGHVPATTVVDEKISIPDELGRIWSPENNDKRFRGMVTLRSALGNSMNIPAVKELQFAGVDTVADLSRRMGISTWGERRQLPLAMALGGAEVRPLDITAAYTVLANNGLKIPPVAITKMIDADGSVIEDYRVPQGEQVVDPRYAYMVTNILSDNNARLVTFGPNSLIQMPRPAAVKTGTTDNYRDTWTIGYTPNLTVGVWVGNSDNHPMREVLSSMSAGKVWREAMDTALEHLNLPPEDFTRPGGLVDIEVCGDVQMRPNQPVCYRDLFPFERAPNPPRVTVGPVPAPTPVPNQAQPARPNQAQPAQPARPQPAPAGATPAGATPAAKPEGAGQPPAPGQTPAPSQPAAKPEATAQPRSAPAAKPEAPPTAQPRSQQRPPAQPKPDAKPEPKPGG